MGDLIAAAVEIQKKYGHSRLGVGHWLYAVLGRQQTLADGMVKDLNGFMVYLATITQLDKGKLGPALTTEVVLKKAKEHAKQRHVSQPTEQDVVAVVLKQAGYKVQENGTK